MDPASSRTDGWWKPTKREAGGAEAADAGSAVEAVAEMKIINAEVSKIKVGKRFRRDLGDIQSLATSMEKQIIHPIAMTPNYELLVGVRRLAAARHLEWQTIPACIIENSDELLRRLEIERDENTERKALTPNEGYAM